MTTCDVSKNQVSQIQQAVIVNITNVEPTRQHSDGEKVIVCLLRRTIVIPPNDIDQWHVTVICNEIRVADERSNLEARAWRDVRILAVSRHGRIQLARSLVPEVAAEERELMATRFAFRIALSITGYDVGIGYAPATTFSNHVSYAGTHLYGAHQR